MNWNNFKTQVLPYKNKLFRFSLRIVGNPSEAEDVVQEVFIKLWNQRTELAGISNLEAWCVRLTKNLSIDKIRSKHRRTNELGEAMIVEDKEASPYQLVASNDIINRIKELMDELPEAQKIVMHLRDIEGYSYQEISEQLEMPMSHVKSNLFRARQKIRQKLKHVQTYGL